MKSAIETMIEEHAFMTDQINKLNTEMPCGHLQRYANLENGTQYCVLCRCNYLNRKNHLLEVALNDLANDIKNMRGA